MAKYDGFAAFDYKAGVPYITLTKHGLTFSKGAVIKVDYSEHVQLLIHREKKQIILLPCDKETQNAIAFYRKKKSGIVSVRWSSRDLINTIEAVAGWDLSAKIYRCNGTALEEDNAVLFDLKQARELV